MVAVAPTRPPHDEPRPPTSWLDEHPAGSQISRRQSAGMRLQAEVAADRCQPGPGEQRLAKISRLTGNQLDIVLRRQAVAQESEKHNKANDVGLQRNSAKQRPQAWITSG